jgi:Transglycosylase-like domain
MAMGPESSGRRVTPISIAAVAAVAVAAESIDNQTPNNSPYVSETRHINEFYNSAFISKAGARLIRIARHPHHTPTHLTPAQIAEKEVSPKEFAAWSKVNICEESGKWHTDYGGLGIMPENWKYYGGEFFSPTVATATPKEQIVVAMRIQENPPDQNGCDPGGW